MNQVEQARVTVRAENCSAERAERLSRLIFYHLEAIIARDCSRTEPARAVSHVRVPALEVDLGRADDDAIARRGATWIHRWLRSAE